MIFIRKLSKEVFLWILKKPKLSQDEIDELYVKANSEKHINYLIACGFWLLLSLFFVVISIIFCNLLIGYIFEPSDPLSVNWLEPGNSTLIMVGGIIFILISIFIGFSLSSIIWVYFMKRTDLISDATIELIVRNGPSIRKKLPYRS